MQHITGISRHQMRISSLEDAISPDNQVRFIDAFVSFVELSKLGIHNINILGVPELIAKLQKWSI